MKRFETDTIDTCWNDSLACLLEIPPKKVPNFLKLYKDAYMDETRKWLKENFNKGIVYIPARAFMECAKSRYNPPIGPSGYSIVIFDMVDDRKRHAAIAFNGGVLWDNGSSREDEYNSIAGYYVIYDLQPERPKWIRAKKKNKVTRKKTK